MSSSLRATADSPARVSAAVDERPARPTAGAEYGSRVALSDLELGRTAYDARRWDLCVSRLRAADVTDPLGLEDLRRLSLSLYLLGEDADSEEVLERAHRLALAREEWRAAAETAFWHAFMLVGLGEPARAGAWLSRCRDLAREHRLDGAEATLPDVVEARGLLEAGRPEQARTLAEAAAQVGRTLGNANLEVLGRLTVGQSLLQENRREEALACLDEVMLTVATADLYPTVAGVAYCAVIGTCMSLLDLPRAQEWTSVLSEWCDSQEGLVPFRGQCLVHRSQIKAMRGDWSGALEEARRASERLGDSATAIAWYQLGEVHRLRGADVAAEAAYRRANSLGHQPEPGLALLRLSQGRLDEAVATFRRLYAEPHRLDRVDILSGYVDAMLAAGDLEAAQTAADELAAAEGVPLVHRARAAEAQGAVLLARGDAAGALARLRPAWELWSSLGMPYDAARVRVRLGDACGALGDDASADLEREAAREVFASLGASSDLARLSSSAGTGPLTRREVEVLRLVAAGHTNRAIAGELVLSEKTVARHLSNIYTKLGIGSRSAATAYAYDHRLV